MNTQEQLESISVSEADLKQFREDGAVCLRGVFDAKWISLLAEGVEENVRSPSSHWRRYTAEGGPGLFFADTCNWARIPQYRDFVFHSPAAALAGALMSATKVNFFHDHLLVKEPGTGDRTPWHQDLPYWCIEGTQVCSIWIPLDFVSRERNVEYVAGSHRWGKAFTPRDFRNQDAYERESPEPPVPDLDAERHLHRFLSWDTAPGDCVAFHALMLHGAPGNPSDLRRRAFSTRWAGDDARYTKRAGRTAPEFPDLPLKPGDPLDCETFPVVWRRATV